MTSGASSKSRMSASFETSSTSMRTFLVKSVRETSIFNPRQRPSRAWNSGVCITGAGCPALCGCELGGEKAERRFLEPIDRLAGLADQLKKRAHAAREPFIGRRLGKQIVVAKRLERARGIDRLQVDLVAQR